MSKKISKNKNKFTAKSNQSKKISQNKKRFEAVSKVQKKFMDVKQKKYKEKESP